MTERGSVVTSLPVWRWRRWSYRSRRGPAALGLLLIGFSQTAGDARAFASKHGCRIDIDQESVAQGMANVGSGVLRGIPVSTSLSASSLNDESGAKTPLASLTTGVLLVLTLLVLAPLPGGRDPSWLVGHALRRGPVLRQTCTKPLGIGSSPLRPRPGPIDPRPFWQSVPADHHHRSDPMPDGMPNKEPASFTVDHVIAELQEGVTSS